MSEVSAAHGRGARRATSPMNRRRGPGAFSSPKRSAPAPAPRVAAAGHRRAARSTRTRASSGAHRVLRAGRALMRPGDSSRSPRARRARATSRRPARGGGTVRLRGRRDLRAPPAVRSRTRARGGRAGRDDVRGPAARHMTHEPRARTGGSSSGQVSPPAALGAVELADATLRRRRVLGAQVEADRARWRSGRTPAQPRGRRPIRTEAGSSARERDRPAGARHDPTRRGR